MAGVAAFAGLRTRAHVPDLQLPHQQWKVLGQVGRECVGADGGEVEAHARVDDAVDAPDRTGGESLERAGDLSLDARMQLGHAHDQSEEVGHEGPQHAADFPEHVPHEHDAGVLFRVVVHEIVRETRGQPLDAVIDRVRGNGAARGDFIDGGVLDDAVLVNLLADVAFEHFAHLWI